MNSENLRCIRVSELIHHALAQAMVTKARDPRFHSITVIAVRVTADFSLARVHVLIPNPDKSERQAILNALNRASGFFRKHLSRQLSVYRVPQLMFVHDESVDRGMRLRDLIDEKDQETKEVKHA